MVEDLSFGITKQDHQNACECKFDVLQTKSLPWKLESDGTTSQWPPSNDFLTSFGYGNAGDEQWWEENTGLEPPSLWNVSGALDLLPMLSMSSIQKVSVMGVLSSTRTIIYKINLTSSFRSSLLFQRLQATCMFCT